MSSCVTIKITGNTTNILSSAGKNRKGQDTRETFTMTSLVRGGVILETDIQIFKLLFLKWQSLNIFENPEKNNEDTSTSSVKDNNPVPEINE